MPTKRETRRTTFLTEKPGELTKHNKTIKTILKKTAGICSLCYFLHLPILSSFILTHFFVFPWTHLLFVNVKMPVFSRAEFYLANLATKFEEKYNIVMNGGKEEEIFSFHAITEETSD